MNLNKMKRQLFAAVATASMFASAATVETWIGGDQSAYQDDSGKALSSFDVADFWSGGVVPANGLSADYSFAIPAAGDYAKFISSAAQFAINGALTVGSAENPDVTLEFVSTRGVVRDEHGVMQPDNSSPAVFQVGSYLSLLGSGTKIKIGKGFLFGTRMDYKEGVDYLTLDPGVQLSGDGIFAYGIGTRKVFGHDYDNLWLRLGQEHRDSHVYTLMGDASTKGRLYLLQGGSGGVGGRAVFDLDGHTFSVSQIDMGTLDNRPEEGNQSSYGGIILNGGTLKLSGSLFSIGDPDGRLTDQSPMVNDHFVSTGGNGGRFEVGGSLQFKSRSDAEWMLNDLNLVLNGDGTEQDVEVLSGDVGDTSFCMYAKTAYGSVTVAAGANARLVDEFDNDRTVAGDEALYTSSLTVEEGATLNLNGLNLYVFNEPVIKGEVVNGFVTRLKKAGFFSLTEHVLGTPGTAAGSYGHWVGPMVAADLDQDGTPELVALTMDEKTDVGDTSLYALSFDGKSLSNFWEPIADTAVLPGRSGVLFPAIGNPFQFEDLGDGNGFRLVYTCSGYSDVIAIAPDGKSAATLESSCSYANGDFILADLDGDGVKDIVTGYRNTGNLRVWSVARNEELWRQTLTADAGIVVRVGVADLDGDRKPEVMAVTKSNGSDGNGLYVFKADGTPYKNAKGVELTNVQLPYGRGEAGGAVIAKDVTGDGVPEIFIVDTAFYHQNPSGHCGYLTVIDQDGAALFFAPSDKATAKTTSPNVQFFDLDGDRVCEFLYDGAIYNGKFEKIDTLPTPAGLSDYCAALSPALVDMNGDQVPEIVYGCYRGPDTMAARWIVAYDPVQKAILTGFPYALQFSQGDANDKWHAGSCQHWNFANIIVADLDGDSKWEIAVGLGVPVGATTTRAALNIIKTPYGVEPFGKRTQKDIGAWQYGRGPLMDFTFPFAKKDSGLSILIK